MDTRRRIVILWALALLAAGIVAHLAALPRPLFPLDDAYIVLHNARVVLAGHDGNFPGVPALVGATSAPHLALVVALSLLLPVEWASWAAAWIAAAIYLAGACRLVLLTPLSTPRSLAVVSLAALAGGVGFQLLNGLETGLAMAAIAWSLALRLDPRQAERPWLALLAGQLASLRPELGLLAGLLLLDRALDAEGWPARIRRLARDAGLAVVSAAPWVLAYLAATGGPFPSTVSAKQSFYAEGCMPAGIRWTLFTLGLRYPLANFGLTLAGLAFLAARRTGRFALAFVPAMAAAYWMAFPTAVGHAGGRYLYVWVPLAWAGLVLGQLATRRWARRAATGVLVAALAQAVIVLAPNMTLFSNQIESHTRELENLSRFVRAEVPPGATILLHDIGYLATTVGNPLLDFVGLKNPRAAAFHREATWASCGRLRGLVVERLAAEGRPGFLVMLDGWERHFRIAEQLRAFGWRLDALRPEPVAYQVYRMTPPPGADAAPEPAEAPPAETR